MNIVSQHSIIVLAMLLGSCLANVCNTTFSEVYAREIQDRVSGGQFGSNGSLFHYMDFTGSNIYLDRQVNETASLYDSGVFGNPHSKSYSSELSTKYVEEMRGKIMEFFSADPEEYELVFTRSATGALYLLGGSFPFSSGYGSSYAYTVSNHNSVLGIRAFAEEKGAKVSSVTEEEIDEWLENGSSNPEKYKGTVFEGNSDNSTTTYSLFAYPAKDNYEGVLYPQRWIEQVKGMSTDNHEWMVLLDTAAYAPTYRLNLSDIHPDFVVISFYKVFGLPTGVGAWLMRKESEKKLRRVYWGGSSVFTATSTLLWKDRFKDAAKWEDGTLPFLEIASLKTGFDAMEYLGGIDSVQEYVTCLGSHLSQQLQDLKHSNGQPLLQLYGKHYDDPSRQSGIANFQILKPSGELFSYRTASRVLSEGGFQVRDGCMCNPGACYRAVGVTDEEVRDKAMSVKDGDYSDWEWIYVIRDGEIVKRPLGSIRVSLGWMSRQADIDALTTFLLSTYRDREDDPQPTGSKKARSNIDGRTSASMKLFSDPKKSMKPNYPYGKRKRGVVFIVYVLVVAITTVLLYGILHVVSNISSEDRESLAGFCSSVRKWEEVAARSCTQGNKRIFDAVIVSTGGVGTTSMLENLGSDWRVNSIVDDDGLKHRPFYVTTKVLEGMVMNDSSVECATPLFLYAFGDIAGSIFSLYRRPGFAEAQNFKTHEYAIPESCFPKTVDEYLKAKVDYLDLENHFNSYIHGGICSSSVPVYFMRIQRDPVPQVLNLLKRVMEEPTQIFPSNIQTLHIKPSHYKTDSETSEKYKELSAVYERLQKQFDDLGHLSVAFNGKITRLI